jgi:hypothetical protein
MKKYLITTSLLFCSLIILAQSVVKPFRHQVRIGAGAIFVGSGDMIGSIFRNEYEYTAHKRLSLAASINLGQAGREVMGLGTKTYRRVKSITTIDANLLFKVIDSKVFILKIGAGLSLKKQLDNDPLFIGFSRMSNSNDPNAETVDYQYQGAMRSFSYGWTVPVAASLNVGRWNYELRPALHYFVDGEVNTSLIFGVGYRF